MQKKFTRDSNDDLHDHFAVTAACFLGFNLKKRTMPTMLAYVAKTHYKENRKKKSTWRNSLNLYEYRNSVKLTVKLHKLTFLLPVIVYALKYLAIPVNWCWVPASCPPMVDC